MTDVLTVMVKEWRELLLMRGSIRGGLFLLVVFPLAMFGILVPWQTGPKWVTAGLGALHWIWLPVFLVGTMIAESFAGERERHTLETLLASRLPDRAILFGKIGAAVLYGWVLSMAGCILSLATLNLVYRGHGWLLFSAAVTAGIVGLSLLGSVLTASGGVLLSLRAATARQAQQTMALLVPGVFFAFVLAIKALAPEQRTWLIQRVSGASLVATEAVVAAALAAVDGALIAASMARFRRTRLVLD